jgi:hypothetical protein
MPLARYFYFVAGVLLALLLISDAFLPKLLVADRANTDLPVIRIHSDRKWPERVVYDTSFPTITPAQIASTEASVPALAAVADVSAKAREREAFAQLQSSEANQLQTSDPKKLQRQRKIAKKRVAPPALLVARQPQFGWFGGFAPRRGYERQSLF